LSPSFLSELRAVAGARPWAKAPLAPFTTIGGGGGAALLVTVSHPTALAAVLSAVERGDVPWFCLGAGSNLLVADEGFVGVVVKLDEGFQYVEGLPAAGEGLEPGVPVSVTVGGGTCLARLAAVAAEHGLSGLEFACGIPGSVGGGIAMNAGAHGACLADVVDAVECVSSTGTGWIAGGDLGWGYRRCDLPAGAVVTAVRLSLMGDEAQAVMERQRSLLRARRLSQPRGVRTFGSVFKNPPGDAAGRLLEEAGVKGVRRGGAEVSHVHTNFVVNLGDATTADILALMSLMRDTVYRASGILLEPEVRLLGTTFPWERDGAIAGGR
jgi:UDP-N-acetylmuramate dehydrogenase